MERGAYAYTNSAWGDQLTSYNGQSITYDSMGNPTTYRGYTFGWRGKQIVSASNGTNSLTFEYNEDGLRQRKTCNNVTTDYYYNGSVLIGMQRGQSKFLFSYDAAGNAVSVKFNGTEYYYLRNVQGDIVKLIDANGATVVEYTYDTWGKKVSTTGSLAGSLGLIQPFRYRGYVYDWELGLYYLQSRYYDPAVGRFISADVLLSTGQGVLGHNCYAYCLDNPVCRIDPSGNASIKDLLAFLKNLIEGGGCGGYTGGGGLGSSSSSSSSSGTGNSASTIVGTGGNTAGGIAATISEQPEEESERNRLLQQNSLGYKTWGEAEQGTRDALGGIKRTFQIETSERRVVDCYTAYDNTAIEVKYGYQGNSFRIKTEVKKDAYLLNNGIVDRVEWIFYRSAISGTVGGSQSLLNSLENTHIIVTIFD